MELLVFALPIVFFLWLKSGFPSTIPAARSSAWKLLLTNSMGVGRQDLLDDLVGHGGEKYLPMLGSIGMFVLLCNLISVVPGLAVPHGDLVGAAGLRHCRFPLLQLGGHPQERSDWPRQAFPWAGLVAGVADASDRDRQQPFAPAFADRASLGQHAGERNLYTACFLGLDRGPVSCSWESSTPSGYVSGVVPLLAPPDFYCCCTFLWRFCRPLFLRFFRFVYVSAVVAEGH